MDGYDAFINKVDVFLNRDDKDLCKYLLTGSISPKETKIIDVYRTLLSEKSQEKSFELILTALYLLDIKSYHPCGFCPREVSERIGESISEFRLFFVRLFKLCKNEELTDFFQQVFGEVFLSPSCHMYLQKLSNREIKLDEHFKKSVEIFGTRIKIPILKYQLDLFIEHDGKRHHSSNGGDVESRLERISFADSHYDINEERENLCLIYNNGKRSGSEIDVKKLTETFSSIKGFHVKVNEITSKTSFLQSISESTKRNSSKSDMIVCCVSSHGKNDTFFMDNNETVSEEEIKRMFMPTQAPSLAGKPKIFFFQVCRGEEVNRILRVSCVQPVAKHVEFDAPTHSTSCISVPEIGDYFICHSTLPGCLASRDNVKGSWFIQHLCELIRQYSKTKPLHNICTMLNNESPSLPGNGTQQCEIKSAVTKSIFLENPMG